MSIDFLSLSGRYVLLSKHEEIQLGRRIQRWLQWEGECPPAIERSGRRARDKFVVCNLRLVTKVAKAYARRIQGTALTFEDLLQEGVFGLQRAAEKYDPECGYAYSTYATWWIRQSLTRAINAKGKLIRVSEGAKRKLKEFRESHMQGDTWQDTMDRAGLTDKDYQYIRQASLCEHVVCLDAFDSTHHT